MATEPERAAGRAGLARSSSEVQLRKGPRRDGAAPARLTRFDENMESRGVFGGTALNAGEEGMLIAFDGAPDVKVGEWVEVVCDLAAEPVQAFGRVVNVRRGDRAGGAGTRVHLSFSAFERRGLARLRLWLRHP